MSKKILAGVLAAASILSVSAVASAAETSKSNKGTYTVTAGVTEGEVDVTLPAADDVAKGVFLNPYHTAVKSDTNKNKSGVASKVFKITNNDSTDSIKVMATVSVSRATGVVVKDMRLNKTSVKGNDATGADACDAVGSFNPLVDYTAIKTLTDKETKEVSYVSGGNKVEGAKQKKNVGIWLVGADDAAGVVNKPYNPDATTGQVVFPPKGTNSGELIASIAASGAGYFAVNGEVNLDYTGEWDTAKDTVGLTIIIKCMPK